MNRINIRPYKAEDRADLRTLCCDVADRGGPIENFFPDREVAADLLTKYYTDYEPQSTFVAMCDQRMVGYINGCMDNRRHGLVIFWLLMPLLLIKAFKRGIFFRPEIHQLLRGMLKNWRRIFAWRKKSFHSHQGHLHIGVAGDFRGQQVGRKLLNTLADHAAGSGIAELAASVHDANKAAGVFFEAQGFTVRDRYPMVLVRDGKEEHYHSLLYVKTISSAKGQNRRSPSFYKEGVRGSFIKVLLMSVLVMLFGYISDAAFADQFNPGSVALSPTDRILVLAPHPDDEVLGAGGVIQQAVSEKLPLKVVFLTYGDSNQWSFFLYRKHPVVWPAAVENMGLVRHDEAINASRILGVDPVNLIFLGYPDFGTLNIWYYHWNQRPAYRSIMTRVTSVPYKGAYHFGAPYKGESIVQDLRSILRDFKPTKIFVSHPADHNGDHLALYLYLRVALWDEGMDGNVQLYPYLIHYLAWPKPKGFHPEKDLTPPEALASDEVWKQYHLSAQQIETKKKALQAHKSQYFSSPRYLLSFVKFNELFGDILPVRLRLNQNVSVISGRKRLMNSIELPEELNDRERSAFVGVDWKSLRWDPENLIVTIGLSRPLAQDVEASIYFFGYRNKIPFGIMPKINVRLGVLSYSVYDQNKRLDQGVVKVSRSLNEVTISVPLKLLGYPRKILTSARTSLGNFPLDNASWVVIELQ